MREVLFAALKGSQILFGGQPALDSMVRSYLKQGVQRLRAINPRIAFLVIACAALGGVILVRQGEESQPQEVFRQALIDAERGDWQAVQQAAGLLAEHPDYAHHAHVLEGVEHLRKKRPQAALARLESVPARGELRLPVLSFTGESLYRLGRLAEAQAVFQTLATDMPDHPEGHRWLAAIYYDLGALDRALDALDRVVELDPRDYQPHWLQGVIYFDFERYGEAAAAYRAALQRQPPDSKRRAILEGLVLSLVEQHEYAEAVELFADNESTDDAATLAAFAEAFWSLGEVDTAKTLLQRAHELDPTDHHVLYWRARFACSEGEAEQAVPLLKEILREDPHDTAARFQLAQAYRQLGRISEAAAELARHQESQEMILRLNELNLQAIVNPDDPQVRDECADLCEALGKHRLALMWRRAAETCRERRSGSAAPQEPQPVAADLGT